MRKMNLFLLLIALMLLPVIGCSSKITKVVFDLDGESGNGGGSAVASTDKPGGSSGNVTNVLVIKADGSTLETTTGQDSRGDLAGATQGANAAIGDLKDAVANFAPDLSKENSENPQTTTNNQTTGPDDTDPVKPVNPDPGAQTEEGVDGIPVSDGDIPDPAGTIYANHTTYTSYGVRNGGRQAWRIPKQGPEFGKKIKVVFSDGHTVYVNDTSHNYREKDGFVFKPGLGPNGEGEADTGTAHHGVYLHAPYGNKSTQVTFYYTSSDDDVSVVEGTIGPTKAILWKPIADSGGKLVVLLPADMGTPSVSVTKLDGIPIENGNFAYLSNPNRATYRFTKRGEDYPTPCLLKVGDVFYLVKTPAKRLEALPSYKI